MHTVLDPPEATHWIIWRQQKWFGHLASNVLDFSLYIIIKPSMHAGV